MEHSASPDLVRLSRVEDLEPVVCRVYQSTNNCIVASELSDSLDLDGLCIIPTKTIRCFDRMFERADFYRAALGAWPNVVQYADLLKELVCDMVRDLRMLSSRKLTLAIHMEIEDPDVCYVGTVREVTDTEVFLDRISSRGKHIGEPLRIELDSITKIEVATRYLIAVGHAAGVIDPQQSGS